MFSKHLLLKTFIKTLQHWNVMNKINDFIYGKEFSLLYDKVMNRQRYKFFKTFLKEKIRKYNINKGVALDLGCGTGEISKILLDMAFKKVVGVDKSKYMLEVAKKKLVKYGDRFIPVIANMENFRRSSKYDLIVSFYDSLNYLIDRNAMKNLFLNVELSLKIGAYFIFDIDTREHVKVAKNFQPVSLNKGNYVVTFKYGGRGDIWRITIEIKEGNRIIRETHYERGYDIEDIMPFIKGTKLKIIDIDTEIKTFNGLPYVSRRYFVLQKL